MQELFKKVCAYYLDGFSEEEVRALYQTIPAGTFTNDKTEYMCSGMMPAIVLL